MTKDVKLTDTQLMLLSQASQREDLLLTIPETLKGGAMKAVISKLLNHGLVEEVSVAGGEPAWRKQDDQRPIGLKLTRAGLEALGLGPDHEGSSEERPSEAVPTDVVGITAPKPASARDGSKRAKVVDLLSREEGASLDDLVQATGWLPHTTRAALTGLRQRGYALTNQGRGRPECIPHYRHAGSGFGGLARGGVSRWIRDLILPMCRSNSTAWPISRWTS